MNRRPILAAALAGVAAVACSSSEHGSAPRAADAGPGDAARGGSADASSGAKGSIQSGTLLELEGGRVQGDTDGGARRFRGIPYAKPPVGALRWKPPQAAAPWSGVLPALDYASACAQPAWVQGPESDTEDCLYLNVWTPEPAPTAPLPVMVWLPGGGNQNGAASDKSLLVGANYIYDGRALAVTRNVVVVTVNYRLGAFGFFSHPGLTAEHSISGNQGLLDQQMALSWVRDNALAFGGDPRNVTLFGESAGSQDTCLQVVSPGSRGLFHRAMSESGGCTTYRKVKADAEQQAAAFADAVGCGGASDQLACLRGKSAKELLVTAPVDGVPDGGAGAPGGSQFRGGAPLWDFNPVVDGTVIPDQPRTLVEAGSFAKVPYILGSNFEEGALFLLGAAPVTTDAEYTAALGRLFGRAAASVAATYPSSAFSRPMDALVRVWGDFRLGCSTYDSARRFARHGSPVRMYAFSRTIPGLEALGPTHGTEMPYVFATLPTPSAADTALSDSMQGYWARFAKSGDPNGAGALDWPAFDETTDQRMGFDVPSTVLKGFRRKECDFWGTIYDAAFP
jgi:para-nitrobenzyl esterase